MLAGVCRDVSRFNTCFIVYLVFKGISVALNIWTISGLVYIICQASTYEVNENAFLQTAWTLRTSFFFSGFGLVQWLIFTPAASNISNIRGGFFIDLCLFFLLCLISWHFNYWVNQLRYYAG